MVLEISEAHDATLPENQKPTDAPKYSQKFSLQRRDQNGFFKKMETFDREISSEEALAKFGPGYYVLKSCLPRFRTVWKKQLGESQHSRKLEALDKRSKYLAVGVGGLAVGEVVGFGLSHLRFQKMEKRVDEIQTVLQSFKPSRLRCWNCGTNVEYFLQKNCTQCGSKLGWPRSQLPVSTSTQECLSCGFLLLSHQRCCPNCGQPSPIPILFALKNTAEHGFLRTTS
jgi:hypothetical protein